MNYNDNYYYFHEEALFSNYSERAKLAKKYGLTLSQFKRYEEREEENTDFYIKMLKEYAPNADALYQDTIINAIGERAFIPLKVRKKIHLCGCVNGRNLYTF